MKLMEVCGTHTAAIFKNGIRSLVGDEVRLISGPGCPVCVTPTSFIDKCILEASRENTVLYSFGDMFKVPGREMSLSAAKSHGANVHLMYSPFEVLKKAEENPTQMYIVAAVGFETTAPIYALLIAEAEKRGIENLRLITSLKSAIPAIDWVASNEEDVDGFICPGHVSVITGLEPFEDLAKRYSKPFAIAGFEAEHILGAIKFCEENEGEGRVVNLYPEAVKAEGNIKAKETLEKYFEFAPAVWRGLGEIQSSGIFLKNEYSKYDLGSRDLIEDEELNSECRCADVIRGRIDPPQCPMFGAACDPAHPHGPCMVSSEGACGIWYQNR